MHAPNGFPATDRRGSAGSVWRWVLPPHRHGTAVDVGPHLPSAGAFVICLAGRWARSTAACYCLPSLFGFLNNQHSTPRSYTRSVAASLPLSCSFCGLLEAFTDPIKVSSASLGAAGMLAGSWGGPGVTAHAFRSTVHLQQCRRDCMVLRE